MTSTPANDNDLRPQWYDDLIKQYDPFLRNYCRTKFRFDEDIYQEAHVILLRTWRSYRPGKSIIPWMRYAVMTARKKTRKFNAELPNEKAGIASVPANQDTIALTSVASDNLTPTERSDFAMYLQGYTFAEIGDTRGVHRQAPHERIRCAMARLRPANDNKRKKNAAA